MTTDNTVIMRLIHLYSLYHVDDLGVARIVDISGLLPSNSQSDSPHCGNELRKCFKKVLQDIQVAARYVAGM